MHEQHAPPRHVLHGVRSDRGPLWVLLLGALLMGLALLLTAYGPRRFVPVSTHAEGRTAIVSAN